MRNAAFSGVIYRTDGLSLHRFPTWGFGELPGEKRQGPGVPPGLAVVVDMDALRAVEQYPIALLFALCLLRLHRAIVELIVVDVDIEECRSIRDLSSYQRL